jgi:diguanylate cyclase (GGDEF)-like protein
MSITVDSPAVAALNGQDLDRLLAAALPWVLQRHGGMLGLKDLTSGRYVYVSAALAEFMHRPGAEVLGCTDAEIFDAPLAVVLRAAEQTAYSQREPLHSEHKFEWGGVRREFSVLRAVLGADGSAPRCLLSVWYDLAPERQRDAQLRQALEQIEQQQQANEMLRREIADQALRDPSSGLYRRAHFEDQLRREVDLSTREHREFSIVFIELDPVASKVQALGEAGQRAVLQAMGRLLRSGTRAMDASCRFDERRFAVLLSGVGLATAHARMEGLRRKCAAQIVVHEGQELGFTVAIGVASFPHTAHTQESLVQACEAALAEAQRRGGNHLTLAAISFSDPVG